MVTPEVLRIWELTVLLLGLLVVIPFQMIGADLRMAPSLGTVFCVIASLEVIAFLVAPWSVAASAVLAMFGVGLTGMAFVWMIWAYDISADHTRTLNLE